MLACFNDEEVCQKISASCNIESFPAGSLLHLLSFNDWVRILATIDKNKDAGVAAIAEMIGKIPMMAKGHLTELTSFASGGAELSNYLKKLCGLTPSFVSTPSTPVIPPSGSIFSRNPAALEAVKDFQINMCSLTESTLLELVPKVSKIYPFLPHRQVEVESVGVNHQLWTLLNKSFIAPIQVETWVFLANLPASALEECRVNALKGVQYLDKGELIKAPFTMSFLDITKCASLTGIYGRTKGTMVFNKQSADYYSEITNSLHPSDPSNQVHS